MNKFGKRSKENMITICDPIQEIANLVIVKMDISCVYGHRGEELQNHLVEIKASKLKWPESDHNEEPSDAGDFKPYIPSGIGKLSEVQQLALYCKMREYFYYYAGVLGYELKPLIIFKDGTGDYAHIARKYK